MNKIIKKAFALEYKGKSNNAPRITAKGVGLYADQIKSAAESETIPVIRNAILADNLTNIELGEEIPEELFESVAIVLSRAYWLKGKEP